MTRKSVVLVTGTGGEMGHGLVTRLVEFTELLQQIVDLVLERELGEDTDRLGLAQALLERAEIEGFGLRALRRRLALSLRRALFRSRACG